MGSTHGQEPLHHRGEYVIHWTPAYVFRLYSEHGSKENALVLSGRCAKLTSDVFKASTRSNITIVCEFI